MFRASFAALLFTALAVSAADWPQWRGPHRDGISGDTGLLQDWPADGPPLRWSQTDIGTGYSSPSVANGRVYLQTTHGQEESCVALDEKTGKQVWSAAIGGVGKNMGPQYPGTRATPTIDGDRAYCLASDGQLACLDAGTGQVRWKKSLPKDLGGKVGFWAYTESVLVDGDRVICTPGGEKAGLAALNKMTGDVIWQSELDGVDTADYASVMPVEAGGKKEYVQFLRKGVVGVDAATGKFLWSYKKTVDQGANILTPVVKGNQVFTSGSRAGGALVELTPEGDGVAAKEIYFERSLGTGIGGAVLVNGHLYTSLSKAVVCVDFATGKVKWKEASIAPASICYADGRLYLRGHGNAGEVALVEASPEAYREHGRFKLPQRSQIQAWPHPVVANGGLYLRDQGLLYCYEVARPDSRQSR